MNLFFIHTPFQVLAAQNLIIKKGLTNNIVVLSNTGTKAKYFYQIFDKMLIRELWHTKYILGDLNNGIFSFKNPIGSYLKLLRFSKKVNRFIFINKIDSLYFGDINHPAYVFLAEYWQNKKKIIFFEEGLSHYFSPIIKKKFNDTLIIKIKKILIDKFIFKSLNVTNFSKYIQTTKDTSFGFDIDRKYNILPLIENSYDEIIKFDIYLSKELESLVNCEKQLYINHEQLNILYLSSTSTSLFTNPIDDEIRMIINTFNKIKLKEKTHINIKFLIKFHPKDSEVKKSIIKSKLNDEGIKHIEIFPNFSFPVETLFNQIKIDFLMGFGSSSQLYFEALFPKIPNYNLFYGLSQFYSETSSKNKYPNNSWINWQNTFFKIFKKLPLKY